MAVDTRAKRLSMLAFSGPDDLNTDPATSGVDAPERADFLGLYRGITLNNPSAAVVPIFFHHYQSLRSA